MPTNINLQHFIFTPKYRFSAFEQEERAAELERLLRHICRIKYIEVKQVAVMPDHVHVFVVLPTSLSVAKAAQLMKWFTSIHLRRLHPELKQIKALWGVHYFSRSVGGDARKVESYIREQSPR